MNDDELNKMREENQKALIESKKQKLKDDFGMLAEHSSSGLPPEVENEWLSYILDFEQQFENAGYISVRERIGNPLIKPLAELNTQELETAIDELFELLAVNMIAIEFLGNWTDEEVYRHLTEELLDEEIQDINIEGMYTNFHPASADYELQMWVENLLINLLGDKPPDENEPYHDEAYTNEHGESFTFCELWHEAQKAWAGLRSYELECSMIEFSIWGEITSRRGKISINISWEQDTEQKRITTSFELSEWYECDCWVVERTSLLDDLKQFNS